jgi:hypothetical protein
VIALVIVQTVVLAGLVVLVIGLLRAYGSVLQRLHALEGGAPGDDRTFSMLPIRPVDSPAGPRPAEVAGPAATDDDFPAAADVEGTTPNGETVALRVVGVDHDTVLVFLSSGCSTCAVFWDELAHPVHLPAGVRLVVVTQDADVENVLVLRKLAPPAVDVVLSSAAWGQYEVPGSPYVVAVSGARGRVRGEGTGQSWAQIADLLARSTGDAGYLTGGPSAAKPAADVAREAEVDRELVRAGLLPGDPRLYGGGS